MICNFYPFNFVISYTNKLPILWFISWYHSNNDWKYYNTFLQSCTFNQDLKEQKWQQDYVWSLNEKTYFKKPNVNATIFPYPLYTSIVYGCSIPHRHSDATQMDKMCVQFLYARRTFQMVAVWNDRCLRSEKPVPPFVYILVTVHIPIEGAHIWGLIAKILYTR